MLNKLKDWIASGGKDGQDVAQSLRLAAAALLVEAAGMDGHLDDAERAAILRLLRGRFQLSDADAETLLAEAGRAVEGSSQLFGFTRTIAAGFDHDHRVEMVEMLWEVAYADGRLHDYEASLVRRVCGLIYVSDPESGLARRRALARLGIADDPLA